MQCSDVKMMDISGQMPNFLSNSPPESQNHSIQVNLCQICLTNLRTENVFYKDSLLACLSVGKYQLNKPQQLPKEIYYKNIEIFPQSAKQAQTPPLYCN